jgi:WD40 repeat protein
MKRRLFLVGVMFLASFGLLQAADTTVDEDWGTYDFINDGPLAATTGERLILTKGTFDHLSGTRLVMHDETSKLILRNCTLALDDDYTFTQGCIEVRGNVDIIGLDNKDFVFQGHNLLIGDGAVLRIGRGIKLNLTPGWRANKQLIRFESESSKLLLDDATLNIDMDSGLLLLNGNLWADGNSFIEVKDYSNAESTITTTMHALQVGNGAFDKADCNLMIRPYAKLLVRDAGMIFKDYSVGSFDMSGGRGQLDIETGAKFIMSTEPDLEENTINFDFPLFRGISESVFSESFRSALAGCNIDHGPTATIYSVAWTSTGNFLAEGGNWGNDGNEVDIYSFANDDLTRVCSLDYSSTIYSVDWNPNGMYLAIGGDGGGDSRDIKVLAFSGVSVTTTINTAHTSTATVNSVSWHPDGRYLAVGGIQGGNVKPVRVYKFIDGTSALLSLSNCDVSLTQTIQSVDWSPDGKYLAVGGSQVGGVSTRVYSFDETAETLTSRDTVDHGATVTSVAWNPCGYYLATGGASNLADQATTRVYSFDGNALALLDSENHTTTVNSVVWSLDGTTLATAGRNDLNGRAIHAYSFDGSATTTLSSCSTAYGTRSDYAYALDTVCTGTNLSTVSGGEYLITSAGTRNLVTGYTSLTSELEYGALRPVVGIKDGLIHLLGRHLSLRTLEIKSNN